MDNPVHAVIALELCEVLERRIISGDITPADAVSCAVGFTTGLALSYFGWDPEKIGSECETMSRNIILAANSPEHNQ